MNLLYTIEELADSLKISVKAVRNKLSILNIKKARTVNRKALYKGDTIVRLKNSYVDRRTPQFEIYESKMNKL